MKTLPIILLTLILIVGCRQSLRTGYQKEVPQMSFPLIIDGNTPPSGSPVPKEKTNLIRLCNPSFLGSWREGNYDYHLFMGLNVKLITRTIPCTAFTKNIPSGLISSIRMEN